MLQVFLKLTASYTVLGVTVLGALTLQADGGGNQFQGIAAKNAFGLKAPAEAIVETSAPPTVAPSNIVLTGVASIKGRKMVFLTLSKQGEKEPKYLRLGENERDEELEVATIDVEKGQVQIRHNGRLEMISFATHGAKPTANTAVPVPSGTAAPPRPPGLPVKPLSVSGAPVK